MPVGKNKVPMAKLREVLTKAGFQNARTYIASGNALVDSSLSSREIEVQIHDLIQSKIGPDLTVVVRSAGELQQLLDANPFGKDHDPKRIFYVSFASAPPAAKVKALLSADYGEEKVAVKKSGAYLYIPGNAARSKLSTNFLERQLCVSMTARNANTITRLIEMSDG